MKKLTHVWITLLLLLPWSAFAASPAIEATLKLPFETVLPGVPVDMTVTLRNGSGSTASAGLSATLTVTLPNGKTVSPRAYLRLQQRPQSEPETWVELAPGESRDYFIPWDSAAVMWCHYGEYTAPGTYDLSLKLEAGGSPENYVGALTTNSARLTRVVPAGDDEVLWKRMATAIDGRWADDGLYNSLQGPAILKDILQLHPASSYYPYALLFSTHHPLRPARPTERDIATALDAVDRFGESPAYPHLLLLPGQITMSLGFQALDDRDSQTAIEYLTRAEAFFAEALKKAPSSIAIHELAEFTGTRHTARLRPSGEGVESQSDGR